MQIVDVVKIRVRLKLESPQESRWFFAELLFFNTSGFFTFLGAILFRQNPHFQALGAVGGLILGGVFSVLICRILTFGENL